MRQRITVFGSNHSHREHVEVSPMEHQWGEDQNGARDEGGLVLGLPLDVVSVEVRKVRTLTRELHKIRESTSPTSTAVSRTFFKRPL